MDYKIYDILHRDAKKLREKVFVEEQGFQLEFDEFDNKAKHVVLYDKHPIATCRFFKEDNKYYIGRICVLPHYRGQHLGNRLLEIAEQEIKKDTHKVYLSAQVRVSPFYIKNGYKKIGTPYDDEGVPHIMMLKELGD